MTSTRFFKFALAAVLCGALVYTLMVYDVSIRELLGLGKAKSEGQAESGTQSEQHVLKVPGAADEDTMTAAPASAANTNQAPAAFSFDEVQQILALVNQNQRKNLLDDEERFKNFVHNEAAGKSVYAAAQANKIDKNERNQLIAQRGTENILREIYIRQITASKIPRDFPSEEQIKSYYEKNKDKFVLGDRLPVWQIFLPVPKETPQKEIELLKKQAEAIASDLTKGNIDFATAAIRYSGHKESKFNGGFMGIVQVIDIKPEILKELMALGLDEVSNPVTTEEGIHIMKRGPMIAKQELKLDDVRNQIKKALINQANNELRQAIFRQAAATYPVDIDDKRIEEWRLKMRIDGPQGDAE